MTWYAFKSGTDENRVLPPERRNVLVLLKAADGQRQGGVAVGYLRYSAGELTNPFFVVPGIGGEVVAWADALGDDFRVPGSQGVGQHGRRARVRLPIGPPRDTERP